jgi:hypothetical protein
MERKRYKAEEIVAKLRQVDLTSQRQGIADAIPDRRERSDLLSLAPRIWRAEDTSVANRTDEEPSFLSRAPRNFPTCTSGQPNLEELVRGWMRA